jgi:hypothetical protein
MNDGSVERKQRGNEREWQTVETNHPRSTYTRNLHTFNQDFCVSNEGQFGEMHKTIRPPYRSFTVRTIRDTTIFVPVPVYCCQTAKVEITNSVSPHIGQFPGKQYPAPTGEKILMAVEFVGYRRTGNSGTGTRMP